MSGNQKSVLGNLTSPAVANSELPGLLGLKALIRNRAVLDFTTLKLYFCGPADYDVAGSLPEGSDVFQLEIAPSGHIVLPCCEFGADSASDQNSLTLLARDTSSSSSSSSSSNTQQTAATMRRLPPSPAAPPVLPQTTSRHERLPVPPRSSA